MTPELGKIEKPAIEKFSEGRKLFCVPLIPYPQGEGIQKKLQQKIIQYWEQASDQISNLEKIGKITQIYHESVTSNGESAMNFIKMMNEKSYQLVKTKFDQGAKLEVVEDPEIFSEYMDWTMCLSVVGRSQKVVKEVFDFHKNVVNKRFEHIAKKIKKTLSDDGVGLLIMADEHRMNLQEDLPSDIQVFLVHPPAFNDIQNMLREYFSNLTRK